MMLSKMLTESFAHKGAKGQMKTKSRLVRRIFSLTKNKRNLCFLTWRVKKQKKKMLFRFLGESTARQSAYGFIWPLSWSKIMLAWYMKSHYMILFFLVVMKMLFSFLSYLWKRYVSRPGHLPEAPPPPFVEMESLMGKVFFTSSSK